MRENKLRRLWRDGGAAVNGWLAIPSSVSAEAMAHQGWDSLTIDMQHGLVDYTNALPMLQGISTTETVPLVRVPWLEPGVIMKALDAGAYGIICPMVNTREDAERFVGACRYAPQGYRSAQARQNGLSASRNACRGVTPISRSMYSLSSARFRRCFHGR